MVREVMAVMVPAEEKALLQEDLVAMPVAAEAWVDLEEEAAADTIVVLEVAAQATVLEEAIQAAVPVVVAGLTMQELTKATTREYKAATGKY